MGLSTRWAVCCPDPDSGRKGMGLDSENRSTVGRRRGEIWGERSLAAKPAGFQHLSLVAAQSGHRVITTPAFRRPFSCSPVPVVGAQLWASGSVDLWSMRSRIRARAASQNASSSMSESAWGNQLANCRIGQNGTFRAKKWHIPREFRPSPFAPFFPLPHQKPSVSFLGVFDPIPIPRIWGIVSNLNAFPG
jgi:hypothetical protein